jgi:hypothetical protein
LYGLAKRKYISQEIPNMTLLSRSLIAGALIAAALLPLSAQAQTVAYSNFGPGNTFNNSHGWVEATASSPSRYFQSVGMEFTSLATGKLSSIDMALQNYQGDNTAMVYLSSSLPSNPSSIGNVLESFSANNLPALGSSSFLTLNSSLDPILTQGQTYYLTAVATGNTYDAWSWNNQNVTGTLYGTNSPTGSYGEQYRQTLGAFSVTVTPLSAVPEAGSLAGFAVMGCCSTLALWRKRRK